MSSYGSGKVHKSSAVNDVNQDENRGWLWDYESSNNEVFATFACKEFDQGNMKNFITVEKRQH